MTLPTPTYPQNRVYPLVGMFLARNSEMLRENRKGFTKIYNRLLQCLVVPSDGFLCTRNISSLQ